MACYGLLLHIKSLAAKHPIAPHLGRAGSQWELLRDISAFNIHRPQMCPTLREEVPLDFSPCFIFNFFLLLYLSGVQHLLRTTSHGQPWTSRNVSSHCSTAGSAAVHRNRSRGLVKSCKGWQVSHVTPSKRQRLKRIGFGFAGLALIFLVWPWSDS